MRMQLHAMAIQAVRPSSIQAFKDTGQNRTLARLARAEHGASMARDRWTSMAAVLFGAIVLEEYVLLVGGLENCEAPRAHRPAQ